MAMALQTPTESDIASRLQRAIPPSPFHHSNPPLPPAPSSLPDLLSLLSPPNSPICPRCRSPLPFGSHSHLCLVCSAPLQQLSPPLFSSSVPFRRLLHALQIDGLEADIQDNEEEKPHVLEENVAGEQYFLSKSILNTNELEKGPEFSDNSIHPVSSTTNTSVIEETVTSIENINLTAKQEEKPPNILDYTANLDAGLLEDFFSNPVISGVVADPPKSNNVVIDKKISSDKENLFPDPITKSMGVGTDDLVPNIHGAPNNTDNTSFMSPFYSASEAIALTEEHDDDAFSSWEGVFQSAKPLDSEPSGSAWFETPMSNSNVRVKDSHEISPKLAALDNEDDEWSGNWIAATPGGDEYVFPLKVTDKPDEVSLFSGNGPDKPDEVSSLSRTGPQAHELFEDNLFLFPSDGLQVEDLSSLSILSTPQQNQPMLESNVDVEDLFRSSRQDGGEIVMTSGVTRSEQELFHPPVRTTGLPMADNSYGSAVMVKKFAQQETPEFDEVSEKSVGSLLAQLRDLSFMLSDSLVVKAKDAAVWISGFIAALQAAIFLC